MSNCRWKKLLKGIKIPLGLSLLLLSCTPKTVPRIERRPNIIILVMDTLRADHLSAYGYHKNTSPNIDKLAKEGILFKSAYAQSNWTLYSFASFLTGKYPRSLGLLDANKALSNLPSTPISTTKCQYLDPKINERELLISERLKEKGYQTAGIFTGQFNDAMYGFNQGFDYYDNLRSPGYLSGLLPMAFKWLDKRNTEKPFFLLINTQDTHAPYDVRGKKIENWDYEGILHKTWSSREERRGIYRDEKGWHLYVRNPSGRRIKVPLTQADVDSLVNRYDASIRSLDEQFKSLNEWLDKKKLLDNTIIVLMSDHGEGLGEHGLFLHCTNPPMLYSGQVKVPLIFKLPSKIFKFASGGRVINQNVELVDLAPTLMALVEGNSNEANRMFQGKSLVSLMQGKNEKERDAFAESVGFRKEVESIRSRGWTMIRLKSSEGQENQIGLFDNKSDPKEQKNLAREKKATVLELIKKLDNWKNENQKMYEKKI